MKTICLTFLLLTCTIQFTYAQWATNGTSINNTNTGYVGIGTSSPGYPLDVNGIIRSNTYFQSHLETGGVGLNVTNYSNADFQIAVSAQNATSRFAQIGSSVSNIPLLINPTNGGNVGIGTTTPDYKLSVNGNFKVFGFGNPNNYFLYSGGADLDMRCADRGTGGRVFVHDFNNICTINYGGDFTGGTKIGSNAFFSEGTTGVSYIKGGYVGIGTTQPDQALTVSGTVHATEVVVDQMVKTPDYVFDKDYDLISLKDVKSYIDQNHHLPEIPSAAQVNKEGINIGEMNARLLKKIEELTLYLIEKDKELSKEKLKNELQQKQLNKINKKLHID